MSQPEPRAESREQSPAANMESVRSSSEGLIPNPSSPPGASEPCPTCGTAADTVPPSYVYALGKIMPRFPRVSVEKEFAQATGRADTANLTDQQTLRKVLQDNRYLLRQLCWVMTVSGLETYILVPRDPTDFQLLTESLRPNPRPGDIDLVIGLRGPMAAPDMCNGLVVPVVAFDQIYSFDRDSLIESIPRPDATSTERFEEVAGEVFDRIMQLADNAGATDEHRALNYLAVRYPSIYAFVADAHGRNLSHTAVDVRPSRLSGVRKIVDVIFSFTHRSTDVVEKQYVRVDVTEELPYLVTKLSPYSDR